MQSGADAAALRVLLIESNPADAALVEELFSGAVNSRFDLSAVSRFEDALPVAGNSDVALLGMPVMDFETLPRITRFREAAPGVAMLVLVGQAEEMAMLEALRLGAQDVILKTELNAQGLRRRVRFAVARKQEEKLLRMLKDESEAMNRARAALLANVSHEIRTPLNAIMGFSEVIRDQHFGAAAAQTYRDYAGDIYDSGRYLLGMINDLLDLSRVDSGRLVIADGLVDMRAVIGATCLLLQGRATTSRVRILLDLPDALPALRGDRDRLQQAIVNLVSNAIKFTPGGGRVTIGLKRLPAGQLQLAVSDTGVGIPKDQLTSIWQPFGQATNAMERNQEGVGLGLPLTAQIVRLHGGLTAAESTLGKGTTVTATFPADRVVDMPVDEPIVAPDSVPTIRKAG